MSNYICEVDIAELCISKWSPHMPRCLDFQPKRTSLFVIELATLRVVLRYENKVLSAYTVVEEETHIKLCGCWLLGRPVHKLKAALNSRHVLGVTAGNLVL